MKDPRCNNITSHFEGCGVNELAVHHLLSSSSALFIKARGAYWVGPISDSGISHMFDF